MEKPNESAIIRKDVVSLVAQVHGVSPRYVRYIINGERENEEIMATYMEIVEQDNLLVQNVKNAISALAL